jgi:hypothetical protein
MAELEPQAQQGPQEPAEQVLLVVLDRLEWLEYLVTLDRLGPQEARAELGPQGRRDHLELQEPQGLEAQGRLGRQGGQASLGLQEPQVLVGRQAPWECPDLPDPQALDQVCRQACVPR